MLISNRFRFNAKSIIKLNNTQLKAKGEVQEKIDKGIYRFEKIKCPICNLLCSEVISEKDRYGLKYEVEICKICGLIFINPRMIQESYNEFYDLEYRRLYLGVAEPQNNYFKNQYKRGKEIFNWIQNQQLIEIKNLKILEVGCSSGGILAYFAGQGCQVLGVDLDSTYLQRGREKYGINLVHGALIDIPENYKPDIVIYSHVLEHILDVQEELKKLRNLSSPETLIYIEVPGVKNIHNAYNGDILKYFQNAHTFHFTLTSLTNLMKSNHFELLYGDEFVRSIFRPLGNNNSNKIRNDYWASLNYLMEIEKRRRLNQLKLNLIYGKIINKLKNKLFQIYKSLKNFTGK